MHKLNDPKLLLAIGTPVVLLLVLIVTNLEAIILPKYRHSELIREAWATYGALCLRCAVVWFAVLGVSLFGGEILRKAIGAWSASGITISWLVATGFGLFAGQSSKNGTENSRSWVDFLASLAPYVFLFGLGCILSMMVDYLPGLPKALGVQEPIPPLWSLAGWLGVSLIVALPLSFWLDVNDISLNALYANRLTRAYLGASNPVRWETADGQPFRRSRFLETDDMRLTELVPGEQYSGPLVLVNTALNLAGGDNLAWQERKAASFVVSPLHLGSADLEIAGEPGKGAYYPTTDMSAEARQGMLGRAVSISGAAANPNMGYHSSPAITALMTFFNVRLGWWVPNPVCKTPPTDRPTSVLKWLFKELFGQTNDKARFLNISDGGHFENLGVYELVRRKCRLVIAVDGEADPELAFHGLGTLIRRCRTDLGCDVEIDVDRLRRDPATGHAREHIAIGTIRYDQVDPAHPVGTLVYIKASLTGDEPTDVNQYAQAHADFPHQTTADQFFDESQFESYRSLGLHCVLKAFRPLLQTRNEKPGGPSVEELVYELRRRGFPPPPETHEDFLAAAQPFTEVHKSFRDEKSIAEMARAMYGDLVVKGEPIERLQGIHTSILMMQVLENAWLTLDLETQYSHPLNTGWMNLVHRWSQIPELRRSWPVIRHEFSRGFVEFCETVGGLPQPSRILVENFGNIETLQRHFAEDHDFKVCGLQEALESTQANRDSANVDVLLLEVVPGEESRRIPVGCLLLQSKSDRGSQLHVWVRPRYRGHGHGTYLMDRLQELICEKKIAAPVRVKLPIAPHATHNAVATDKARLLSFFTRYGFRVSRVELKTTELILE
jgi:ribosomal protein S18 acetylase RimI-like enzyme